MSCPQEQLSEGSDCQLLVPSSAVDYTAKAPLPAYELCVMIRVCLLLLLCVIGSVSVRAELSADTMRGTDISGSYTAINPNSPITLRSRFNQTVNVRDYGAKCDNSTDDRNAFSAAITRANSLIGTGVQAVVYVPPGVCLIKGTNGPLPMFTGAGGVMGDGTHRSWIYMDSTYTGDLFSWSEAWMASSYPNATTVNIAASKAGPWISGLTIVGNRAASATQYALKFYDRNDFIVVRDVDMFNIKGPCFQDGVLKNTVQAFIRESEFHNIRCFSSGDTGIPAWDFNAAGTGNGGTPVDVSDLNIYAPYGPGMTIRNGSSGGDIRGYKLARIRVEGQENNPANVQADLLTIGDTTETGGEDNIHFSELEVASPYSGFCGIRMTAQNAAAKPYFITINHGKISQGAGAGKGLCIDAGRDSQLEFIDISTSDTNVTIGSSTLVGANITVDGNGAEQSWTWSIDATINKVAPKGFVYVTGDRIGGTASVAASYHDGSSTGGNALGAAAVDLQTFRTNAVQAATGVGSVIGGGEQNVGVGQLSTIAGGFNNNASGQYSAIPGGRQAGDRGRIGILAYASGEYSTQGDAEATTAVVRGSGATASAFRLTTDANAAGNFNCFNIPDNAAYSFRITLHARDNTASGKDFSWILPNGILTRDSGVGTTAISLGTPVTITRGTVTGASVSATADTTAGCINLSFTPPSGNTDTWHAVARIDAVEVQ